MSSKLLAKEEKIVGVLQLERRRETSLIAIVEWLVGSGQGRCGLPE